MHENLRYSEKSGKSLKYKGGQIQPVFSVCTKDAVAVGASNYSTLILFSLLKYVNVSNCVNPSHTLYHLYGKEM